MKRNLVSHWRKEILLKYIILKHLGYEISNEIELPTNPIASDFISFYSRFKTGFTERFFSASSRIIAYKNQHLENVYIVCPAKRISMVYDRDFHCHRIVCTKINFQFIIKVSHFSKNHLRPKYKKIGLLVFYIQEWTLYFQLRIVAGFWLSIGENFVIFFINRDHLIRVQFRFKVFTLMIEGPLC